MRLGLVHPATCRIAFLKSVLGNRPLAMSATSWSTNLEISWQTSTSLYREITAWAASTYTFVAADPKSFTSVKQGLSQKSCSIKHQGLQVVLCQVFPKRCTITHTSCHVMHQRHLSQVQSSPMSHLEYSSISVRYELGPLSLEDQT